MALEVGIVGLPNSGKTTLFNALTRAGAEITAYASVTDKPNVGMAAIADERLGRLAELVHAKKVTPAAIRVVDVPGTGPQLLGNLRQVDAILAVLDGFSDGATPDDDLETLKLELLVADRDHVERRHERVQKEAKSGDAGKRSEAETLAALLAHLDAGNTLADWPSELPPELDPLTTKPLLAVANGPGGIDCKLEAELAELPDEEAVEFRDGETALDAAATIHSDIARGFIRCEVISAGDLLDAGSHAEAAKRGTQRLEGKTYVVADGDVLNIRFNV